MVRAAVVDDNPVLLERIGRRLCSDGWEVLRCSRGDDVISLIERQQPDLILLNLSLNTGMTGRTLLDHLEMERVTRSVALVVYCTPAGVESAGSAAAGVLDAVVQGLAAAQEAAGIQDAKRSIAPAPLSIQLLGRFRVSIGSSPIADSAWSLRKARTLVKLLALAPAHRLHREEIMEVLWPYASTSAATKNLHTTLHAARHALEPVLPPRHPSTYLALADDFLLLEHIGTAGIDVDVFREAALMARSSRDPEACEAALRLYAGDLLPEDRNEDWSVTDRMSLTRMRRDLLLQLARLRERQGKTERAIDALYQVVDETPADEEAQAALIRLLAGAGKRIQAFRQYELLRTALDGELGVEPDIEIEVLLEGSERAYRTWHESRIIRAGSRRFA